MSFAKYQYKTGLSPFETRSQELNPVFPRTCHSLNHLKHRSLLPRVCVNRKLESRMELWLKFSTTVWNVGILNDALTPYWKWANAQIGNAWPIIFRDITWRTKVISYIRTMEKNLEIWLKMENVFFSDMKVAIFLDIQALKPIISNSSALLLFTVKQVLGKFPRCDAYPGSFLC